MEVKAMSVFPLRKDSECSQKETQTVTQYWICEIVDPFRKGQHIYEINGTKYVVMAYCSDKKIAIGMCSAERMIAIMEVPNFKIEDRLAHKKNWIFLGWLLPAKLKRLR